MLIETASIHHSVMCLRMFEKVIQHWKSYTFWEHKSCCLSSSFFAWVSTRRCIDYYHPHLSLHVHIYKECTSVSYSDCDVCHLCAQTYTLTYIQPLAYKHTQNPLYTHIHANTDTCIRGHACWEKKREKEANKYTLRYIFISIWTPVYNHKTSTDSTITNISTTVRFSLF